MSRRLFYDVIGNLSFSKLSDLLAGERLVSLAYLDAKGRLIYAEFDLDCSKFLMNDRQNRAFNPLMGRAKVVHVRSGFRGCTEGIQLQ